MLFDYGSYTKCWAFCYVEAFSYFNKKINQYNFYYLSSDVTNDIITRTS